MIIEYKLEEADFLTFQLYFASKNVSFQKRRKQNRFIVPIAFFAWMLFVLYKQRYALSLLYFAGSIIWYFLYPILDNRLYVWHYRKDTHKKFFKVVGRLTTLQFERDYLLTTVADRETKILSKEIAEIIEIGSHIFIKLLSGETWIIPKAQIEDVDFLEKALKSLAISLNVPYKIDSDWAWK